MIVYVESNFVLEIVFEQEQASAAKEILRLAEAKGIALAVPAFSLIEPSWTIEKNARDRLSLLNGLMQFRNDVRRSQARSDLTASVETLISSLEQLRKDHVVRLATLVHQLFKHAAVLDLTVQTLLGATDLKDRLGLTLFDSVVFCSILEHAASVNRHGPRIFATRDKNLVDRAADAGMSEHSVQCIPSYEDALRVIASQRD